MKILIAGIGGVGGYFGGLLARHYEGDPNIQVCFVARGRHLEAIRNHGLQVVHEGTAFIARPAIATDDPAEIGPVDVLLLATKGYDLPAVLEQLRPCIGHDTLILPLLNGVDSKEKIEKAYPGNLVLDGCVYIVSRLREPGLVENLGNIQVLHFGLDTTPDQRLRDLEQLFREAGIDARLSGEISRVVWEKFIFISALATATSCFDKSVGAVLADPEGLVRVQALLQEATQVAQARRIAVPTDMPELALSRIRALPYENTSSMHIDFQAHPERTEWESLTGYVLREGQRFGLEMEAYGRSYGELERRVS